MAAHVSDTFIEFLSQVADFFGVGGEFFLSPSVGDGSQHGDQRHRRGQDHALLYSVFKERRVLFQGSAVKVVAGQKQHHEFGRRLELIPIRFSTQRQYVIANLASVVLQFRSTGRLVIGLSRLKIGRQRRFGVNDDVLFARQANNQVRAEPALLGGHTLLFVKIAMINHAGHLDDSLERHFAPAPGNTWRA